MNSSQSENSEDEDLEFDDLFSDDLFENESKVWFTENKIETIKKIHEYLFSQYFIIIYFLNYSKKCRVLKDPSTNQLTP